MCDSQKAKSLFLAAIERDSSGERLTFLDAACDGDATLRARVERLLEAHRALGTVPSRDVAATADAPPSFERPSKTIGPYKLLEEIGEGGMGQVFMAEQTAPVRRKVAIKIIKPGMDSRQVIARFEAERQALAMMDHPNIARVLDAGATRTGQPYFVMELVRGIPITEYCDRERLSIAARLELFVLVCRAVQHAHQKGIIHRDIKPSNVLITLHDGVPVPKVIDFGIAKATGGSLTEKTLYTEFSQLVGTPLYMSPEQAELSGLDIDTRSDIYSLGVLLYELLTGTTPFDSETLRKAAFDEMRRIIREEEPPKPSTRLSTLGLAASQVSSSRGSAPKHLNRSLRGELDWVVMRALEKDRRRRYGTANDFAADVMRHLTDQPVEACPPSAWYRLRKAARRNRGALTTAAVMLTALVTGTAVSVWQAVRATQAERRAREASADTTAVLDYLVKDVFGAAAPEKSRGRTLTLPDLLKAGAVALPDRFKGRPLAEAACREALSQGYYFLGRFEDAETQARQAVELRSRILGSEHPETLNARAMVVEDCHMRVWRNRPLQEATIPLARQVVESRRRVLGPDHPDTLSSVLVLCALLLHHEDRAEAGVLLQQAYAAGCRALGPDHPTTLRTLMNQSRWFLEEGNAVAAEATGRQAYAGLRRTLGPGHYHTLLSLAYVARAERSLGRLDAAIRHQLEVAEGDMAIYGPSSMHASGDQSALIEMLWEARDSAMLRAFCERWLRTIMAERVEADPYLRYRRSIELARLYWCLITFPEPIPFDAGLVVRAAEEVVELSPGWGDGRTMLGLAYERTGRPGDALKAIRTNLERNETRGGDAFDWLALALIQARQGEPDQARVWYDKARNRDDLRDYFKPEDRGLLLAEAEALLGRGTTSSELKH